MYVDQLFEAQVEQTPDAIALVQGDQHLTYGELNRRANQLAHYLLSLGVSRGSLVGLSMDRSFEIFTGLLAILKARGAYVPLDPAYPQPRLRYMIEDSRVPLVLTKRRFQVRLADCPVQTVCVDEEWEAIGQHAQSNLSSTFCGEEIAYVIYTSGSTGKPKGVAVPHRGVMNHTTDSREFYHLRAIDRVLQFSSLSFDASVEELFPSWASGAAVVLWPPDTPVADLAGFTHLLQKQALTVLNLPTAYWHAWVEQLGTPGMLPADPLRLVIVAGEIMLPEKLARWQTFVPATIHLANTYGPTETTIISTFYQLDESQKRTSSTEPVPIGHPIANTFIYLLDEHSQMVPAGEVGEIYIGGAGVAHGYLSRPDLTAEKFVPDPFTGQTGARLYRTGDYGRYRADGLLECIGRIDQQVKVRGYRIELGEIEAVIRQHPGVQDAVVLAREDPAGEKRLVAYAVSRPGQTLTRDDVRRYVRDQLPEYMVPSIFVSIEALPLTPNGKVDRRALPEPEWGKLQHESAFIAPRTAIEEVVAGIWAEVLGLERVGVYDNFFELGGHSLLGIRIISRVRQAFQREIPTHAFFSSPCVAELARLIEEAGEQRNPPPPPIRPVSRDRELPLSFSQERVWFFHQMYSNNLSYQTQTIYRFTGALDVAAFVQSVNELVRRHEILRTTFISRDERPVQVIHQARPVWLPLIDLQALSAHERAKEQQQLIHEASRRSFDPGRLPLIQWTLVRLDAREHVLIFVEHHLVHDGWSSSVLLKELLTLYRAFSAGEPSPLADPPIQFADFACWQREWMQGEVAESLLAHWKERLAGPLPALKLPTDRPRPPVQSFRGSLQKRLLPTELSASLRALCRQEGVTLFMGMLAAFFVLLYRYSGQKDLCVGSGVANRRWRETEDLVGMIVNNVVLRADLSGDPTFRQLLHQVRNITLDAYTYEDLPFDLLVKALQPERDLSRNPLFQVMFSFHDSAKPDLDLPGLTIDIDDGAGNGSAKFDLNVIVMPEVWRSSELYANGEDKAILMLWEYNTDLFDEATITRIIDHYQLLLTGIVAHPAWKLSNLPYLLEEEQRQLLREWNHSESASLDERGVIQLFEAQVQRAPDAIALVSQDEHLTYDQLNRSANRLAHLLSQRGVGPEVPVGLVLPRCTEAVVALLAILKAGGLYVPLDPHLPPARLAGLAQQANVAAFLTRSCWLEALPGTPDQRLALDTLAPALQAQSEQNPASHSHPEQLAYLMFTSGSTGTPKGVGIPHRGIVRLVTDSSFLSLTSHDTLLLLAPLGFDASTFELWASLLHGARLVIGPPALPSLADLAALLAREQISTLWLTAGLFQQMVEQHLPALRQVRSLLAGGDVLPVPAVLSLLRTLPGCRLINGYGPTENTTFSCCCLLDSPDLIGPSVPIGRPIAHTQVFLLDEARQPVPLGAPGELYLGGAGLARGYLSHPDQTALAFVPDHLSGTAGARLYRTGDRARYRADGRLEFLGRLDRQVKIRGYRIEPGEVEAVLRQHPGVREVVVLAHGESAADKRLVAYLVGEAPTDQVRRFLQSKLPDPLIPSLLVRLDALPLTPNGKLDRQALPAPDTLEPEKNRAIVEPRSPIEEDLRAIWIDVLKLKHIGIYDNFFEIGGHSLLAIQVISRIRRTFQVELPLHTLFESPTIADLALEIVQRMAEQVDGDLLAESLAALEQISEAEAATFLATGQFDQENV